MLPSRRSKTMLRAPRTASLAASPLLQRGSNEAAGVYAAWPGSVRAQPVTMTVIGLRSSGSQQFDEFRLTGLRQGLNEAGYVEGRNIANPARSLPSDVEEHLPAMRIELAGLQRLGAGYVRRLRRLVRGARQGPLAPSVYFHRLKALGGGAFQIFRGIQSRNTGVLSSIE